MATLYTTLIGIKVGWPTKTVVTNPWCKIRGTPGRCVSLRAENILFYASSETNNGLFGVSLGTKNELFEASYNRSSLANGKRKKGLWRGNNLSRDLPLGRLNRIPVLRDPSRLLFVYVEVVGGDEFDGGYRILAFQDRTLQ